MELPSRSTTLLWLSSYYRNNFSRPQLQGSSSSPPRASLNMHTTLPPTREISPCETTLLGSCVFHDAVRLQ